VENWERDRLGRSGWRPAGRLPREEISLGGFALRRYFRSEAENGERDARAPLDQLNRSGLEADLPGVLLEPFLGRVIVWANFFDL
jgi:hypothetical protein